MYIDKEKYLNVFFAIILLILTMSVCSNIAIPYLLWYVLFLISGLIFPFEYCVGLLFLMVPFYTIVPMDSICLIFIATYFLRTRDFNVNRLNFILLVILIFIDAIAELKFGGRLKSSIVFSFYLMTASIICLQPYENYMRRIMQNCFVYSLVCALISSMYIAIKVGGVSLMLSWRLGMPMQDSIYTFTIGSNGTGLMCLLGITILISRYLMNDNKKNRDILISLFFILCGLLTQSRAFLVGLAATVILFSIFVYKERDLKLRYVLGVTILAIISIYIYMNYLPESVDALLERFATHEGDITNGRTSINGYYIENMFNDLQGALFGYGLMSYRDYLGGQSIHNALLEVFISWGILGGWISIAWIYNLIKTQIMSLRRPLLYTVIPMCIVLLMVQSTRLFRTIVPIFYLMISIISIYKKNEDE